MYKRQGAAIATVGGQAIVFMIQLAHFFGSRNTVAFVIGGAAMLVCLAFPTQIVSMYMNAAPEILAMAPSILRQYFVCFLFLPFNVFATYYLQAVKQVKASVLVSVLHGFLLSGSLAYVFPLLFGADSIWLVMPCAECMTMLLALWLLRIKDRY